MDRPWLRSCEYMRACAPRIEAVNTTAVQNPAKGIRRRWLVLRMALRPPIQSGPIERPVVVPHCSAMEAAGQTRRRCRAKVRGATFKPEPSTNQALDRPAGGVWHDKCALEGYPPLFMQEYHSM